jgi:hypothetical protein
MRFFVLDNLSMTRQDNSETAVVKIEDEDLLSASVTSRVYYLK